MSSSVSVIVATKNSRRTIGRCLESIRGQRGAAIEIIVVDNFSTDGTFEIAENLADKIAQRGPERSAQRNAGIQMATSDYVLIIDSDMVLNDDVVTTCLTAIDGHCAVAVPEVSFGSGFWSKCKTFERTFYESDALLCAARFFRKQTLLELGGYDETMYAGEDWDLSMRVCGREAPAFANALIYHDEGQLRLRDAFLKKYYYGVGLPIFIRKHGTRALSRLSPLRASLLRNVPSMVRAPLLGAGLITLKGTEMIAGSMGMLVATVKHGAERRC